MPRRNYTLEGITAGISNAVDNLQAISVQKEKMKQQRELFNLQKKKAEIDLQTAEIQGEDVSNKRNIIKQLYDIEGKKLKVQSNMMDAAFNQNKAEFDRLSPIMQMMNSIQTPNTIMPRGSVTTNPRQASAEQQVKNKVMTQGLNSLTDGEREIWGIINKSQLSERDKQLQEFGFGAEKKTNPQNTSVEDFLNQF